jgi:hypothetical protein
LAELSESDLLDDETGEFAPEKGALAENAPLNQNLAQDADESPAVSSEATTATLEDRLAGSPELAASDDPSLGLIYNFDQADDSAKAYSDSPETREAYDSKPALLPGGEPFPEGTQDEEAQAAESLALELTQYLVESEVKPVPKEPTLFDDPLPSDYEKKLEAYRLFKKNRWSGSSKNAPDSSLEPPTFELKAEDVIEVPLADIDGLKPSLAFGEMDFFNESSTPDSVVDLTKEPDLADISPVSLNDLDELEKDDDPDPSSIAAKPLTPAPDDEEPLVLVDAIEAKAALLSDSYVTSASSGFSPADEDETALLADPANNAASATLAPESAEIQAEFHDKSSATLNAAQNAPPVAAGSDPSDEDSSEAPSEPKEALDPQIPAISEVPGLFSESAEDNFEALEDNLNYLPEGQIPIELFMATLEHRWALKSARKSRAYYF